MKGFQVISSVKSSLDKSFSMSNRITHAITGLDSENKACVEEIRSEIRLSRSRFFRHGD